MDSGCSTLQEALSGVDAQRRAVDQLHQRSLRTELADILQQSQCSQQPHWSTAHSITSSATALSGGTISKTRSRHGPVRLHCSNSVCSASATTLRSGHRHRSVRRP